MLKLLTFDKIGFHFCEYANVLISGEGGKGSPKTKKKKKKKIHARHKLKKNSYKAQIENKFLHCKGTRKKYRARTIDETVYNALADI